MEARLSLNLDPGTFGGTKACHILIEMLNATDDRQFAQKVITRFNKYFETMGELLKLDNPTRAYLIRLHFEETVKISEESLKPDFDRLGISFSYFNNILIHRRRQQENHGELLEKFRAENREHHEILYALRKMSKLNKLVDQNQI